MAGAVGDTTYEVSRNCLPTGMPNTLALTVNVTTGTSTLAGLCPGQSAADGCAAACGTTCTPAGGSGVSQNCCTTEQSKRCFPTQDTGQIVASAPRAFRSPHSPTRATRRRPPRPSSGPSARPPPAPGRWTRARDSPDPRPSCCPWTRSGSTRPSRSRPPRPRRRGHDTTLGGGGNTTTTTLGGGGGTTTTTLGGGGGTTTTTLGGGGGNTTTTIGGGGGNTTTTIGAGGPTTTSTTLPVSCAGATDCDDGDPCTTDDCPAGICTFSQQSGAAGADCELGRLPRPAAVHARREAPHGRDGAGRQGADGGAGAFGSPACLPGPRPRPRSGPTGRSRSSAGRRRGRRRSGGGSRRPGAKRRSPRRYSGSARSWSCSEALGTPVENQPASPTRRSGSTMRSSCRRWDRDVWGLIDPRVRTDKFGPHSRRRGSNSKKPPRFRGCRNARRGT